MYSSGKYRGAECCQATTVRTTVDTVTIPVRTMATRAETALEATRVDVTAWATMAGSLGRG